MTIATGLVLPIDGVKYPGAARIGRASYVLFGNRNHVVINNTDSESGESPWLELVDVRHRYIDLSQKEKTHDNIDQHGTKSSSAV